MSSEDQETTMDTSNTEQQQQHDDDERKLFVGGLPQDAKEDDIRTHFATFGEVDAVNLKTDPHTGRSRGFAFVVFTDKDGVEKATSQAEHTLKGKVVAVKKAQAKQGKIYVGKLTAELSDDQIKEHFAQFGAIANIEQPHDKVKNERKNFCFITFEKEETAKKLLKEETTTINGVELQLKRVTPKGNDGRQMFGGRGGGRGGFGGGWGAQGGYGGGGYGNEWGYAQYAGYGAQPDYYGWGGQNAYGAYGGGGKQQRGRGGPGNRGMGRGAGMQRQYKPY